MKKLIILALITASALTATAQKKNAALAIFNKLEQEEDVLTLSLNKKMLESIDSDVEWGETMRYLKGDLHSVKVMLISESDNSKKITSYIYKELKKLGYKRTDLPDDANDKITENENIFLFTNKKGKRFTEAYMLIEDENGSGIFVSISGDIEVTEEKL